jgi:cell division protein FtsQ
MPAPSNTPTRSALMEPRIRVRRAQVRRQEGRRRLHVLVAVVACASLGVGGWVLTRSPLLDVDRVVVEGAPLTGTAAAVKAGGVRRGTAMVDVDEGAAARRLGVLPWVRSVRVTKEWPGTVRIRVVERTAVAMAANSAGGWALVDGQGRVLTWSPAPAPGILAVAGLPPAGPPGTTLGPGARGLLDVVGAVPMTIRALVANVVVGNDGINLGLTRGGKILLGGADDVAAKLRTAELVLAGVDTTNLEVLDVRLPTAPTVTRVRP